MILSKILLFSYSSYILYQIKNRISTSSHQTFPQKNFKMWKKYCDVIIYTEYKNIKDRNKTKNILEKNEEQHTKKSLLVINSN